MKQIQLLFSILLLNLHSYGQVKNYIFSQENTTYTKITEGIVFGNSNTNSGLKSEVFVNPAVPLGNNDNNGPGIPIGFEFTFNGERFDRIAIDYNGWISFGKSSYTPSVFIESTTSLCLYEVPRGYPSLVYRNRISAFNTNFKGTPSSEVRVATIGNEGSRTLIVQWTNVKLWNSNVENYFNFQIKLHEGTNTVSIVYGAFLYNGSFTSIRGQVGLGGFTNEDFNNRLSESSFASTGKGTTNRDEIRATPTGLPSPGLAFTWTPPSCVAPPLSSLQVLKGDEQLIYTRWGRVTNATSYQYLIDTTATPPITGINTSDTTASAGGFSLSGIVYAHVRTNCGNGVFSSWITRALLPCVSNTAPQTGTQNISITDPTNFEWNPLPGASSYQIYFSTDNGATYQISRSRTKPPYIKDFTFKRNTEYRWYVRAITGLDSSSNQCAISNSTTFTTQANDSCGAPLPLKQGITYHENNVFPVTQSIPPSMCNGRMSATPIYDMWYSFKASNKGVATITATNYSGSTLDIVLQAYSGSCNNLTLIGCSDTALRAGNESLTLTGLIPYETYLCRVYGFNYGGNTPVAGGFIMSVINESPKFTTANNGNWNNPSTWTGNIIPPNDATIVVRHILHINADISCDSLELVQPGEVVVDEGVKFTIKH